MINLTDYKKVTFDICSLLKINYEREIMKKAVSILLTLSLIICFNACGSESESSIISTEATTTAPTTTSPSTSEEAEKSTSDESASDESNSGESSSGESNKEPQTSMQATEPTSPPVTQTTPVPVPMDRIQFTGNAEYGQWTGTSATFTGLEPLPEKTLPIIDPDNLRGLSTTTHNHSYGVSKGGVPHEISVNNQKLYEKYGGLCLDTSGEKVIYLTFDCGYENGCTGRILDTLKEKNVPAAFFVTLSHVKSNPDLIARMINEGHIVGNHSDTHPNFSTISRTRMVQEIQNLDNYLRTKFGYSAPYFRFPEGACSENSLELVQSIGFKSVFWSTAYADWDVNNPKGKQYAFDTVTSRLHPGCVLLLHAVSYDNADALGDIIDYARAQGYVFKSL